MSTKTKNTDQNNIDCFVSSSKNGKPLKSKKYSLLVFDWDGTLMDSRYHIIECVDQVARDFGMPSPSKADVRKYIGAPSMDFIRQLFPGIDVAAAVESYHRYYLAKEDRENFFDGAIETLQILKEWGYKFAIATNKTRSGLAHSLAQSKLDDLFIALRCGDDQFCKPDPEVIWGIMRDVNMTKQEILMIGDTEYDMQTAISAGVDAVAAGYGARDKELLLSYNPVACIDDISELKIVL